MYIFKYKYVYIFICLFLCFIHKYLFEYLTKCYVLFDPLVLYTHANFFSLISWSPHHSSIIRVFK